MYLNMLISTIYILCLSLHDRPSIRPIKRSWPRHCPYRVYFSAEWAPTYKGLH